MDVFTPLPLEALHDLMPVSRWPIPLLVLAGGIALGLAALAIQVWANLDHPINVGGRPLLAWTAFSLPTPQFAVLGAVAGAVLAMLALNGLPRLHHPVFAAPEFAAVTGDGFFLLIERAPEGWPSLRAVAAELMALGVAVAPAVPSGRGTGTGPLARAMVRLSAGLILLAQGIEAPWLTLPVSVAGGWTGAALSVLALGAVAVPFLAVFLAVLAKRRPLPRSVEPQHP